MSAPFEFMTPGARWRWGLSFAFVLVAHIAAAGAVIVWQRNMPDTLQPSPAALLIDMQPMPAIQQPVPQPVVKPQELPEIEKAEVVIRKPRPKKKTPVKPETPAPKVETSATTQVAAAPMRGKPVFAAPAPPSYLGLLMAHLENYKRYPSHAQRMRHTGKVYVVFSIDRAGRVLAARVDKGSGHPSLDREALATIRRADPLPAPPTDMPQTKIEIRLPIGFSLE